MKFHQLLIFLAIISCNNKSNNRTFVSELGYTIVLPENWDEYEDEKNTNAFFDITEWTGNLRIISALRSVPSEALRKCL
ncbi:DUF3805 domain-containing protein [Flavobacterium pectinovorum]|uniref:DUF3805 domain-containing protein n=1 Tax=Flavobacterium pectinovorum TaxID=29533 RepID=A0A502EX70_9FLAO|nr:DUF3805 domain-containing protein [Flavobacterium pectinovorum]